MYTLLILIYTDLKSEGFYFDLRLMDISKGLICSIRPTKNFAYSILITVSKVQIHDMLACQWMMDFMTRPTMRMKWSKAP